jgi:hypothetical protein
VSAAVRSNSRLSTPNTFAGADADSVGRVTAGTNRPAFCASRL